MTVPVASETINAVPPSRPDGARKREPERTKDHPSQARVTYAVVAMLALSFVAVLTMTIPTMFGANNTEWLGVATPFAQWIPALAVLMAAWAAGLRLPVSKLWSLTPVRRSRGARPWGSTMLIVTLALLAVPAMHLGAASLVGLTPWIAGSETWIVAAMVVPMLVVSSLSALGEEVAWRGFLWRAWRERLGMLGTILASTVAWVLWHVPLLAAYGVASDLEWRDVAASLISLTIGSVLLGLARERGGNVWPAVLGHGLMNSWLVFANSNLVASPATLNDAGFWAFHALSWAAWALVLGAVALFGARRADARTVPLAVTTSA